MARRPRIELSFRSFKLVAEETEAIQVVRWPLRILLFAVAVCLIVLVLKAHPFSWLQSLAVDGGLRSAEPPHALY
jgi:hypothetical protein